MSTSNRSGKRTEKRARQEQAKRRQRLLTIITVSAAAVIVAALLIWPYVRPAYQGRERPQVSENSMGDPNAPVKVEEFSDFQCPFCRQFSDTMEEDFVAKYVATGKVHFTYVPFSFLGPESLQAAEAAYCAMDQGKFWDFHDILFANQAGENAGNYSDSKLKGFAKQLKLDTAAFNACFDANTHEQKVLDNLEYGRGKGVNATPYFIVNDGTPVDMNALEAAVDAALAAAQ
jgi:protein-disulfide isomerase